MACSAMDINSALRINSSNFSTLSSYSAAYDTQHEGDVVNCTGDPIASPCQTRHLDAATIVILILYMFIFVAGIVGNGLVITVILKHNHLKTVTNLYLLNLAITDSLFLLALPLTITVGIVEHWIFGRVMCKLFFTLDCVNKFMSAFTVTVMAGDRYIATCHPITSLTFRKRKYAMSLLGCVWVLAFVVMLPAIYYAGLVPQCLGTHSCAIVWPETRIHYSYVFVAYSCILAFIIPVICICTFYAKIMSRLGSCGPGSIRHRRHCQFQKATRLVTLVIGVFICCWLPYWCMQVIYLFIDSSLTFRFYQVFTALCYANSMLNPLLYGFTNDYFREAFNGVFCCHKADVMTECPRADACGQLADICEQMEVAHEQSVQTRKEYELMKTLNARPGETTHYSPIEIR